MTDRRLQNFVNGKYTDTADGRTSEVVDPSTGEVYAQAPISGRQDVDAAMQAPPSAAWPCSGSPTRSRRGPTRSSRRKPATPASPSP